MLSPTFGHGNSKNETVYTGPEEGNKKSTKDTKEMEWALNKNVSKVQVQYTCC